MGDPPKLRNKFERPKMLWDKDRLSHDKALKQEYGLKCMRELWLADSELRKVRREARRLLSLPEEARKDDTKKLLSKLTRNGMLKEGSTVEDVLGLEVRVWLERRLQTMVLRKGLARTISQSRQLITHGFISIEGRKITVPSYVVPASQEGSMSHSRAIDISVKASEPEAPAAPAAPAAPVPAPAAAKEEPKAASA